MSTEIKRINGIITDGTKFKETSVIARFTSDRIGESLSLQVGEIMIAVPFGAVMPIIKKARTRGIK